MAQTGQVRDRYPQQIIGVAGGFPGVQNGVHFTEHLMKALHALRGVIQQTHLNQAKHLLPGCIRRQTRMVAEDKLCLFKGDTATRTLGSGQADKLAQLLIG